MANQSQRTPGRLMFFLLALIVVPAADGESNRSVLNRILEDRMTQSEPSLGEQIEACERIAADRQGPVLDAEKLSSLGAKRHQVVTALAYLHARNQYLCEREMRQEGALKRDVLAHLQAKRGKAGRSHYSTHDRFLDEGYRYHRLAGQYRALPLGLRRHLEERVGHVPFNLTRVLEASGYR